MKIDWTSIIIALIPTIPTLIYVVRFKRNTDSKLDQIHVLVNSRLTEALGEIKTLKRTLAILKKKS